jgi:hypothetical protein
MKTRKYKEKKMIDEDQEHQKILFELGFLDDLENWELYQKQEKIWNKNLDELDSNIYFQYVNSHSEHGEKIYQ